MLKQLKSAGRLMAFLFLTGAFSLVFFLVVSLGGIWLSDYSLAGSCGNEPISEIQSPDKSLKVVIFQRNCGATTGFSTQVSILPANRQLPNESGNIMVVDTDHGKAPSGPRGVPEIIPEWKSDRELVFRIHPVTRTFGIDRSQPKRINVSKGWFDGTEVTVRVEQLAR